MKSLFLLVPMSDYGRMYGWEGIVTLTSIQPFTEIPQSGDSAQSATECVLALETTIQTFCRLVHIEILLGTPISRRPSSGLRPNRMTIIGHDVWMGWGAVVLQGVTVGVGAVIGANTVVTRDVLPFSIIAGSPPRIIRRRFPDDLCDLLLKSEWWTLPEEILCTLPANNPEKCAQIAIDFRGKRKLFGSCWIDYCGTRAELGSH